MKTLILLFFLVVELYSTAQVAVNSDGSAPDNSAILDVKSTTKGMLIPRMTSLQRDAIPNPAKGLMVFCTDNNSLYTNTGTTGSPQWQTFSSPWSGSGSNLYYSLGKVGIGTSGPAKPLDVASAGGIQISNGTYASSNNELYFIDNGQLRSMDDNHRIVFNRSGDQLEFNEKGRIVFKTGNPITEVMRISSSGWVGIGTNAPAAMLDVNGSAKINGATTVSGNVDIGSATSSKPLEVGGTGGIQISNGSNGSTNNELFFSDNGQIRSLDGNHRIVFNRSINQLEFREYGSILFKSGLSAPEVMRIANDRSVGIGTAAPNASAILTLGSTNKGFLPPRMTQTQRNTISPVEGLMIYNTTTKRPNYYDGSEWKNYNGSSAQNIGDPFQGGRIAYILQSTDPGYDPYHIHGLLAAPSDLQTTGFNFYWGCKILITGANGSGIGSGAANTSNIVLYCDQFSDYAAYMCDQLSLGGYSDWYLPSTGELDKLYQGRIVIGGFVDDYYWSSTQYDTNDAYARNFLNGALPHLDKSYYYHVRPVRMF